MTIWRLWWSTACMRWDAKVEPKKRGLRSKKCLPREHIPHVRICVTDQRSWRLKQATHAH